jgi:hypothetical protein
VIAERSLQDLQGVVRLRCADSAVYLKGSFKGLRYIAMNVTDIRWQT